MNIPDNIKELVAAYMLSEGAALLNNPQVDPHVKALYEALAKHEDHAMQTIMALTVLTGTVALQAAKPGREDIAIQTVCLGLNELTRQYLKNKPTAPNIAPAPATLH